MASYSIPDMTCNHCKAKIEDAVLDLDEGASLDFDMEARTLDVDSTSGIRAVAEAIKAAGFTVVPKG